MPFRTVALALLLSLGQAAQAQPSSPREQLPAEVNAVLACQTESSAQQRLACYDAAAGKLASATTSGAIVVVDKEELRKTRRTLFGFSLPRISLFRGDSPEDAPEQMEAKIQSAKDVDYGRWLIVLDNGAVWQTTEVERKMSLPKEGQNVTIKRAALNSYFLSINGRRPLRAMRVR